MKPSEESVADLVPGAERTLREAPAVRPAEIADADEVLALRHAAEDWLAARGIDQWRQREVPLSVIVEQVGRGEFSVVVSGPSTKIIGAFRYLASDPEFWGDDATPARYVHGLVISREFAGMGLGRWMLDVAAERAADEGAEVLRLDCAESNLPLRRYYLARGFAEVGRRDVGSLFSVTLFERELSC